MKLKHTLLSGAAALALIAGANVGLAQSPGGGTGAEPRTQGGQPAQGTQRGGQTETQGTQRQGGQAPQGQTGRDTTGQQPGATREGQQRGQAQERGQREQKAGEAERDRSPGQRETQREGQTTQPQQRQERGTAQEGREGKRAGDTTGAAPARVTTEQRTQIREHRSALARGRVDRTQINFNISVGTTIPRTVTLYELPPAIVEVVPAWRRYRYIMVEEQIVIIDPGTYEIIAVISV
jgi:hypothetical protein